jgi:carbon-monoxide dehydrogenase medium subunit
MIPAAFDYARPSSVEETVSLLAEHGDEAKVLAGGHSLLPLMKLRLATPSLVVDVGSLPNLNYVRVEGDEVAIGALSRYCDLKRSPVLAEAAPIVAHVAGLVGDPQVRHRGTIGGSVAHGDPASDLPAVLLALGGSVKVVGPEGERTIPASELFEGFLETAVRPDELLVELRVPRTSGGWSYQKFNRRAIDWAIVAVAVAGNGGPPGVALVNMASTTIRAEATEAALAAGASAEEAAQVADQGSDPPSDLNASEAYRRHLARVLVRRALVEAGH